MVAHLASVILKRGMQPEQKFLLSKCEVLIGVAVELVPPVIGPAFSYFSLSLVIDMSAFKQNSSALQFQQQMNMHAKD